MVIQNKKLTIILFLLIAVFIIALFIPSEKVYADTGPKSSTTIYLENMPESHYICTLLSEDGFFLTEGYVAPNIPTEREHYYGDLSDEEYEEDVQSLPEVSQRRISYVEKLIERLNKESFTYKFDFDTTSKYSIDGKVTTVEYTDGYYPPDKFIAVVYDIDNDILYYSNPIQRYVFRDQYSADYTAGFTKVNDNTYTFEPTLTVIMKDSPPDIKDLIEATQVVQTIWYNVVMFIGRIILTVGIELLIALAFKFTKKSYGIIAITNVATQILLNAIILISMYFGGPYWSSFEGLLVGEAAVFVIEPIVYWKTCERFDGTKKHVVLYGLIANAVTLALGIGINLLEGLL